MTDKKQIVHIVITPQCKENRGHIGAIDEALERLRRILYEIQPRDLTSIDIDVWEKGLGVNFTNQSKK